MDESESNGNKGARYLDFLLLNYKWDFVPLQALVWLTVPIVFPAGYGNKPKSGWNKKCLVVWKYFLSLKKITKEFHY